MASTAPIQESVASELREAATLAVESIRAQPARSALAIVGVVIGIVTVVLVSSTLVGLRNSVALLFRELGRTSSRFISAASPMRREPRKT
jgi:hypothetical protein